jgi:hypothetical protein
MRKLLRSGIRASLRHFESWVIGTNERLPFPPIFIISPPRSGSTLLYLLAVKKFDLAYFSNFSVTCPESPAVLTLLSAPFGVCSGGASLQNSFGETIGWNAPNQGYRVWNRWFPTDRDYLQPNSIPAACRRQMRRTIAAIERIGGSPFINKWQRNTTRVQALHAIFPEALFLHLRRDAFMTAQSILLARRKLLADEAEWFSAMPRSYVTVRGKSHLRQAAEQVALLEQDLEEDRKLIGEDRFFTLSYEELCQNPDLTLETFAAWYASRSGLQLRQRKALNMTFTGNNVMQISNAEVAEIGRIFDELRFEFRRA